MKSSIDDVFKVDSQYAEGGVIFMVKAPDSETGEGEVSFRLRHFSPENPRTKAALASYLKPHARQIEIGTLDQKIRSEVEMKLLIDISLVSWTGITIDDKPAECNKENALKLFKHAPELFRSLLAYAQDFKNYKEDVGNS